MLGHDQRDEDAEPAVILAGIADRIVVRRQDQRRRVWIVGGIASNDVGSHIDRGGETGLVHPAADLGGDGTMRRGEIGAGQPVRRFRPMRQPVGKRHDLLSERRLPGAAGRAVCLCRHVYALFVRHRSCNAQYASVILPRLGQKKPG